MSTMPAMKEFRTETTPEGILHLIFDMPGRSMNVFSNAAIHEIDAFATWLKTSTVRGVVIRSGKTSAFCAGADLGELGEAYDMIVAARPAERKRIARDHFAPIGRAFRKLETAGKPVAAAIDGLALGGGCEFAMGCHYRVLTDTPRTALGLPESLVGLLPGGGGTQRMPRLVGLERSLPILLEGARLSPQEALEAGAADEVVAAGGEVATAERWVLGATVPAQPWDRPDWHAPDVQAVSEALGQTRARILAETGGHYPAPLAILDCIEQGLPAAIDDALGSEIDIFADLIKRPEPRNMIRSLFIGRQDYDKRRKADALPGALASFVADVRAAVESADAGLGDMRPEALRFAGFTAEGSYPADPAEIAGREVPWFEKPGSPMEEAALKIVAATAGVARAYGSAFAESERALADFAAVTQAGFPSYLGGPFAVLEQ
ncbi:enoyl-CoA hydratase-related protein [Neoaquamicrobium microcysteis]|nr:enoyl-CoA hydratase-related protein [Mesorhizobium microcysteis]